MIEQVPFDQKVVSRDMTITAYFQDYIFRLVQEIEPLISSVNEDHTTKGRPFEIVICNNTVPRLITIHTPFKNNQRIIIKRQGKGAVTYSSVDGIDGVTVANSLLIRYDSVYLIATDSAGEWSKISPSMTDVYGSMYIGSEFTVSISGTNPIEIKDSSSDGWLAGKLNNVTFSASGDLHYLQVTEVGRYVVDWDLSFHKVAGGGTLGQAGIMIDDVASRGVAEGERTISANDDTGSVSGHGHIDCPNGNEQVSLWIGNSLGNDQHVVHGNLVIELKGSV